MAEEQTASKQTLSFQAESRQLLELMAHSIYSNKEIFLRELISNASDALDRLRFEALTDPGLAAGEPRITLETDDKEHTLTVADNGIGMSREELVANIGTIAKSGTRELVRRWQEARAAGAQGQAAGAPDLIGQFGVGFYSVFMVAQRVVLLTRRPGSAQATRWESDGAGTYTVEDSDWAGPGTRITLFLKPADEEDGLPDFTREWTVRAIVKRYSDFVRYPIVFRGETLNSMKALWTRPAAELEAKELGEFYRHLTHDSGDPLAHLAMKAEGLLEYQALLFVPPRAPWDLFYQGYRWGLRLYVKGVQIMDDCEELLPSWLRFVKGVVDSPDLPLNISREILQHNRQIRQIRSNLTRKVLERLAELKDKERAQYLSFWRELGRALKEGLLAPDAERERLLPLLLFASSAHDSELTDLAGYVGRMPAEQKEIYYLTGESRAVLEGSPHVEALKARGQEVLFLTDPIDELVLPGLKDFEGKAFKSLGRGALDDESSRAALAGQAEALKGLLGRLTELLKEQVSEVRLTSRLTSSPACLVTSEDGLSPQLRRLLAQSETPARLPEDKRILELNPGHELVSVLNRLYIADDQRLGEYAELVHGQALLAEGSPLPRPGRFARLLTDLLVRGAA